MHDAITTWQTFARERGYRFTAPDRYPETDLVIEASIESRDVELRARERRKGGFVTTAHASARHAMTGRVEIRSARPLDVLTGLFLGRRSTGHRELDATLTAFTSSAALLATILDPLTIDVLRLLGGRPRFALVYENGAIAARWAGIERSPEALDAALRLAAHLAITGGELSPYR